MIVMVHAFPPSKNVLMYNVTGNRIRRDFYSMSDDNLGKVKKYQRDLSNLPSSNCVLKKQIFAQ